MSPQKTVYKFTSESHIGSKKTRSISKADTCLYQTCFEEAPISLWEEDFYEVKKYFGRLRKQGVENFREYFETHPKAVSKCASLVKITRVNKATLKFYDAKRKKDLQVGLNKVFGEESYGTFREELIALAEGRTKFEVETTTRTLKGRKNYIALKVRVASGYEETLSKVLISITDLTENRQIEESLGASEKKYSTLVEKGNDGIIIIQDSLLKFVNQKTTEITDFAVKSAIGKPFIDFVSPEYKELVMARYKKRLAGEKVPEKYEIELLAKGGRKIPVEVSASLIEHEGRPADMAILRDITDRREVEKTLQEEKGKLDAIYKTIKDGLALYDRNGRVIFMNPSLKKLFGVKTNLLGVERAKIARHRRKYFKYYLERYDDSLETQRQVYAGKSISNVMMKIHSKPARYLEGNYVPIKDAKNHVVGMSASFRNVTVLKNQSEKIAKQLLEMEKQKERVQAIFNNVEEGVYIFDKNLKIIQANNACEIMADCEEKEMIGKTYYEIFGCRDKVGHFYPEFDPVSKVITTKESVPYDEHLHTSKNGKQRWVGVSYTPIFNGAGDIEQIVGVVRDITAIKELEKAKSEFVSVASHELRTPLTVINGYLSLLLSGDLGKLGSEKSKLTFCTILNKVKHETERLTKLVGELLSVSRIEEGRLRLVLRKLPIIKLVDEITSDFKAMAAMKGVRLQVIHKGRENGRNYYVMADQDKFKEILVNLLDNAIKFTESGGEIVISYTEKKGQIDIGVKDTGVGIEPTMLPRVFDKFQQISGSYLKENKGTGLGLFIVKSLVEMHKGKIWVESEVGAGTEFNFSLPLVDQ